MKKLVILLSVLVLVSVSMGALVSLDPWVLPMGRVSMSAGNPTSAVRYGLLNFIEVGASMRELGGYMKFGFTKRDFGGGIGIATFFDFTNIFGAVGFKMWGFELDVGGRLVQTSGFDSTADLNMVYEGEISYVFSREGNSESKMGFYGRYTASDLEGTFESFESGIYISANYKDVFFMPCVRLSGGIMFHYDGEPITLYKNFG
ncbi:MAG: hypothetical protein J7L34_09565, partial [Thermotogaceae bacterium]|nr:hypothetical protein [Thermotogaceae bacterium]